MSAFLSHPSKATVHQISAALLPGHPVELIRAAYARAPGNELESGKFLSPESSSALAANVFGLFLDQAEALPLLPGIAEEQWPVLNVELEGIVRFPWAGGRHPCLDALIRTRTALIGVESKRYEPFRSKGSVSLSGAYLRSWGIGMRGYERVRDGLNDGTLAFAHLDAAQLMKHAFGLHTAVQRRGPHGGKTPVLYYVYAEPRHWSDGRAVPSEAIEAHRMEITRFTDLVCGNEVSFVARSYREVLSCWRVSAPEVVREHASRILERFEV